jgi:hypothetical protein
VATTIFFSGGGRSDALTVTVIEDPERVSNALREEAGRPVQLRLADEAETSVFVNPTQIAYWHTTP